MPPGWVLVECAVCAGLGSRRVRSLRRAGFSSSVQFAPFAGVIHIPSAALSFVHAERVDRPEERTPPPPLANAHPSGLKGVGPVLHRGGRTRRRPVRATAQTVRTAFTHPGRMVIRAAARPRHASTSCCARPARDDGVLALDRCPTPWFADVICHGRGRTTAHHRTHRRAPGATRGARRPSDAAPTGHRGLAGVARRRPR